MSVGETHFVSVGLVEGGHLISAPSRQFLAQRVELSLSVGVESEQRGLQLAGVVGHDTPHLGRRQVT